MHVRTSKLWKRRWWNMIRENGYGESRGPGPFRTREGRPDAERDDIRSERGWWDRATDEVSSWLGDTEAERRRNMDERRDRIANRDRVGDRYGRGKDNSRGAHDNYQERRFVRARDVMSRDVVRVHPQDSLRYAAKLMAGYDCGALPVVDRENRLVGMITDRDIAVRGVAERRDAGQVPVGVVMTDEAFACHVNDSLKDCMRAMADHQVRRMPIVDDRERVVGIISQADVAQHAGRHPRSGERRAVADVLCAVSERSDSEYR